MAYRKKTLRSMSPVTRKVARLIGELDSIAKRFKNLLPEIQRLELDSRALRNSQGIQAKELDRELEDMPDILTFENTSIPRP